MTGPTMRTLGFRTHVLMALAAAAGLVATLGRPWYAPAPAALAPNEKPVGLDRIAAWADDAERWVTDPAGTTGWTSLDHVGVALAAMAGIAALGALLCLIPAVQLLGRDLLRYGALVAAGLVAWKLIDTPGPNAVMELRNGAIAAAGCAIVLFTCAMSVAADPVRRKVAPPRYGSPTAFG